MSYNWEKIFKDKTSKELYKIYKGNTQFPKETSEYAKRELGNRDFDFNNMEVNKYAWKLTGLIEDENDEKIWSPKWVYWSFKHYSILLIITLILFFFIFDFDNRDTKDFIVFTFIVVASLSVFVHVQNCFFKRQKNRKLKRKEEINAISEKLEKQNYLKKGSNIKGEINRVQDRIKKDNKIFFYFFLTVILLLLILLIYDIFIK